MAASTAPKVSVVLPVYNGEKYLRESIDSVLAQTFTDFELLVIDDGSTDGTRKLVESITDPRVKLISYGANRGLVGALNAGLGAARGQYVLRMDHDDLCEPTRFQKQVDFMEAHPEVGVCGTNFWLLQEDGSRKLHVHPERHTDILWAFYTLGCVVGHPTVIVRKSVLDSTGIKYDPEYNGIEDYHFWSRLAPHTRFANLQEPLLQYRIHSTQITRNAPPGTQERFERIQRAFYKPALRARPLAMLRLRAPYWISKVRVPLGKARNAARSALGPRLRTARIFAAKLRRLVESYLHGWAPQRIPIVINSYNRLSCLEALVGRLESLGMKSIVILDNNSTYPPLLDYYARCPHRVIRLGKNLGYLALWESGVFEEFRNGFYVYTDCDVVPEDSCPRDFMVKFRDLLRKHPSVDKVGFGLRIDDLPNHFALKDKVVAHESDFWKKEVAAGVYEAAIDTTFALYRPRAFGGYWLNSLRTGAPYVARHLPWYEDSSNLSAETQYYVKSASKSTHWTVKLSES
jgi:glycosyltransferase involved in cell wall biosynthesis